MYSSLGCKSNARRACSLLWASVLVVLLLLVALPSIATTYYVSPTGDDSSPGTVDLPWKSIGRGDALQLLQPGDVVVVEKGTYWQDGSDPVILSQCSGSDEKPIVYKASGLVSVERNSDGATIGFRISTDYTVIDGFEITGYQYGIRFESSCQGNTVTNCVFHDLKSAKGEDPWSAGVVDSGCRANLIHHNVFYNSGNQNTHDLSCCVLASGSQELIPLRLQDGTNPCPVG